MLRAFRILLVLCLTSPLFAQQANITSLVPLANYGSDSINIQTLVPIINVPIRSKGGPVPFNATDSGAPGCFVNTGNTQWAWNCQNNPVTNIGGLGLFLKPGFNSTGSCGGHSNVPNYQTWYITDNPGNGWHPLSLGTVWGQYCGVSLSGWTQDGSGLYATITTTWNSMTSQMSISATITDKFGNTGSEGGTCGTSQCFTNPSTSWTDPFGNAISVSGSTWTDPLNPSPGFVLETATGPKYEYDDATGTLQTITLTDTSKTLKTTFGCSNVTEASGSASLITKYAFPDSSSESFGYESVQSGTVTGRINSITLRTGGQITYTYGSMDCTQYRPLSLTRVGADGTTTFTVSVSGSNGGSTTTVLDPAKNKTVYTFTGYFPGSGSPASNVPALTEVQVYQNTGTVASPINTLLTTDVYCYNTTTSGCPTAAVNYPISKVTVTHTINGMSNSSKTVTSYDTYGNVTEVDAYDFGGSTPTEKTIYAYGNWNTGNTCTAIGSGIFGKVCYVETDMGSNEVARSNFQYDTSVQGYPGFMVSHRSLTTGTTYLNTTYSPNANGTVATRTDPNSTVTTYSYNGTGGCNSLLPTSVSVGGVLSTSTAYECNGGTVTSMTDPNSNVSDVAFNDPLFRLSSAADPYSFTWTPCYGTLSGSTCTASATSASGSSSTFNSTNSQIASNKVVDTFGRPITAQIAQGPLSGSPSYDTLSVSYGWGGTNSTNRMVSTSEPCTAASGANCSSFPHSVQYDPLGRPISEATTSNETIATTYSQNDVLSVLSPAPRNENNKQVQTQYDGLGRVTSVCAVSSAATGSCGQNVATSPTNGFVTTTSYTSAAASQTVSSTRGSETRSSTVDALGRVTSTTTPEEGTTTYTYDSAASGFCGAITSEGDLVYSSNPNNNICYLHDGLHRLTDTNNSLSGSTCRRLRYDATTNGVQSTPSGYTGSNLAGRLVEAETDNCSLPITSSTMITDEWFNYDKDGRMTDLWELAPGTSSAYYHSTATYFSDGTLNTVHLASPSLYTMTYGVDGEGRWKSLSGGPGSTTIVSGVTFAPTTLEVDLGTGSDKDNYTYDGNTGNMLTFKHTVGSANETGTLTWNGNRTLGNLAISDGFNSAGTQTCYYTPTSGSTAGYDDLGRLLNVNCGSTLGSTAYSYDQYDNLQKTANGLGVSWNPGYDAHNHYTLAGTSYDSAGNLTNDSFHTYTWDGYGQLATIDKSGTNCATAGWCFTRDALGNVVSWTTSGGTGVWWYTPLGKTVQMVGGTQTDALFPAPGGGLVLPSGACTTSCTDIYFGHPDWLGSQRIASSIPNKTVYADQAWTPYGERYDQISGSGDWNAFAGMTGWVTDGTFDITDGSTDTARDYNAAAEGRFISPDPAHSGWNLYAYTTNPNSFTDPSGLDPQQSNPNSGVNPLCTNDASDSSCNPNNAPLFILSATGPMPYSPPWVYAPGGEGLDPGQSSSNPDASPGPDMGGYSTNNPLIIAGLLPPGGGEGVKEWRYVNRLINASPRMRGISPLERTNLLGHYFNPKYVINGDLTPKQRLDLAWHDYLSDLERGHDLDPRELIRRRGLPGEGDRTLSETIRGIWGDRLARLRDLLGRDGGELAIGVVGGAVGKLIGATTLVISLEIPTQPEALDVVPWLAPTSPTVLPCDATWCQ